MRSQPIPSPNAYNRDQKGPCLPPLSVEGEAKHYLAWCHRAPEKNAHYPKWESRSSWRIS